MGTYIDIAFADLYIDQNPIVGARWQAYTDPQKNNWIDYVEQEFDNLEWIGDKTASGQTREFPRSGMDTNAEDAYPTRWNSVDESIQDKLEDNEAILFDDLKYAVCEAIIAWIRTLKFQKLVDLQDVNTEEFTAGVNFKFRLPKGKLPLPEKAWRLMYPYARVWWMDSGGWITRV
jgi:hypothetical protein